MGLEPTSETIVEPSSTCKSGTNIRTRLHKYSGLVYRKLFGETGDGSAFECDGLDLCVYGEDENNVEILEVEDCTCPNATDDFSGAYRVRDESGSVKRAFERAPRDWCEESNPASSAGGGPPRSSGDVVLIDGLNFEIKSKCTPLQVRFFADICGWRYFPSNPEAVQDFIEWTVFKTEGKDGERGQEFKKRCSDLGTYKFLGCYDIPGHSKLEIEMDAGYQYLQEVTETFSSNLGEIKIVADVREQTSRNSLVQEDC